MNTIEVIFKGKDVTLKSEDIESLGVAKGDKFEVRPSKPVLVPADFSEEEREKRAAILDETWGAWTEEDEEADRKNRELMNRVDLFTTE